jgi:tRNA(adenine34) deaminase
LNHHTDVVAGVMADECGQLLKDFFASRRVAAQERRKLAAALASESDPIK